MAHKVFLVAPKLNALGTPSHELLCAELNFVNFLPVLSVSALSLLFAAKSSSLQRQDLLSHGLYCSQKILGGANMKCPGHPSHEPLCAEQIFIKNLPIYSIASLSQILGTTDEIKKSPTALVQIPRDSNLWDR